MLQILYTKMSTERAVTGMYVKVLPASLQFDGLCLCPSWEMTSLIRPVEELWK